MLESHDKVYYVHTTVTAGVRITVSSSINRVPNHLGHITLPPCGLLSSFLSPCSWLSCQAIAMDGNTNVFFMFHLFALSRGGGHHSVCTSGCRPVCSDLAKPLCADGSTPSVSGQYFPPKYSNFTNHRAPERQPPRGRREKPRQEVSSLC